jgi:hypothetical protein
MTLDGNISPLTRQFILDGVILLSDKKITCLHQTLIHTLAQESTTPVAHLALDKPYAVQCKYASPTVQTVLHVEMKIGIVLMSTDTSLRLAPNQLPKK